MRIAILTSVDGNGGSAATAFHTARVLKTAGWEAVLFAPGDYWATRGRKEGIEVRALELRRGFHPLSFVNDLRAFRAFARSEKPDLVLVQKSPEQWLAFLSLKLLPRKPALVRLRGVVTPVKAGLFNRWLHTGFAAVICSASIIAERYGPVCSKKKIKLVLEGVDTHRYAPATKEQKLSARQTLGLFPNAFYIGTAGRPAPVKGHDLLIGAFAAAWESIRPPTANPMSPRDPRLVIFSDESRRGPGSYGDLAEMATRLNIAPHVTLKPGFIEDMRVVYHALDVYVLPSRGSEGSSRAGLEASASGLPLIASSVGVLPDLIQDGVTGRLIEPNHLEALKGALTELFETWPAPLRWGAAARARMESELSEAHYARKLQFALEQALDDVRAPR